MDFTQRMLERNRSGQIKLQSTDENSAGKQKEVQHNIVTTISSGSVGLKRSSGNNKVTIETTISWSKLPPLSPSHPVIEVISDGTTSTDAGSESSDEKENEKPKNPKCPPHYNMKSKLQRLGAMYSDDPESPVVQRTEDHFTSEVPRRDPASSNTKPAGRRARLAALADTINHWEDDPRHFPVGKQLDTKVSNQSSVLTKHSVMKDKENSEHRRFISPQKGSVVSNKNNQEHAAGKHLRRQNPNLISLKRPESTISNEKAPKTKRSPPISETRKNAKPMIWDKTVIDSLEAQGFFRSISNQRLIYNYEKEKPPSPEKFSSPTKVPSPVKLPSPEKNIERPSKLAFLKPQSPPKTLPVRATSPVKVRYGSPIQMGTAVLKRTNNKVPSSSDEECSAPVMGVKQLRGWSRSQAALAKGVDRSRDSSPTKQTRDPAELPLAERMALFERNAGPAVLPRAPFALPAPCGKLQNKSSASEHKSQQLSSGSLHDRLALFENGPHEKQDMKETLSERQQELDMLNQRWNRNKEAAAPVIEDLKPQAPPSPPPLPSPPEPFEYSRAQGSSYGYSSEEDQCPPDLHLTEPEEAYSVLREVKKVRFSPTKPGCMYPNLPDMDMESEAFEQENSFNNRSSTSTSSKDSDVSISEQKYVKPSKTSLKRDWSASDSSGTEANEIDDFLEEALDISTDESSPPKRSSYSSNMREEESRSFHQEYSPSRRKPSRSSSQPLLHTVSFYRKQQNMAIKPTTPVQHVEINPSYLEESFDHTDDEMDREMVKQKIERLQQEVTKQQTYMSQASQALDLCYSTFEFSGSTELLEAEKLLLLASQRRQALLQEIQRLRVEGRLYCGEPSLTERGSLTISHVTLPLKMDVVHHAAKDDECYYLLCVVHHNEEVQCSEIMSARRSLHSGNKITFPNKFTVRDLYNDFKITIELYAMKARHKELIPHDIKYHINTNKKEVSKLRLTPRKTKADPRLVTQSSSAGRTSAFTLAGHLAFSLRDIHRTQFTLCKSKHVYNNVAEGSVQLRLESEMRVDVEYRGFLTMFENVAGLGAWHRRWCLLQGDKLSYWRYPDDERKKIPLDTIELSQCTIKEVEVVRRDVCARPNTLQLFTVRPARHTDTESLVVTRRGDRTCIRHWLSADTREERDQWCHHLTKALTLMRAWGVSTAL